MKCSCLTLTVVKMGLKYSSMADKVAVTEITGGLIAALQDFLNSCSLEQNCDLRSTRQCVVDGSSLQCHSWQANSCILKQTHTHIVAGQSAAWTANPTGRGRTQWWLRGLMNTSWLMRQIHSSVTCADYTELESSVITKRISCTIDSAKQT